MNRIARYLLMAAGVVTLAGTPALFAGDFHYDEHHERREVRREDRNIRRDHRHFREDVRDGRYRRAERNRRDWRY